MTTYEHEPVMPGEISHLLVPRPGDTLADVTLGLGGHAELLGRHIGPTGTLVGVEWDGELLERAKDRLDSLQCRKHLVQSDFRQLPAILNELGLRANEVIADLGVCSVHFDNPDRGFSFAKDAPLDMRFDRSQPETAETLLGGASETEIERILREYGEERWSKAIARQIVARRDLGKMKTTGDLVEAVAAAVPPRARDKRIHFATRTFQGVRCALSGELDGLEEAVEGMVGCLAMGGRIAVIAYHSLEDRQVKRAFAKLSGKCVCPPGTLECRCGKVETLRLLTRGPVTASEDEVRRNPRSRSAKLRAAERSAA